MVAVESRSEDLVLRCIWQEIPGDLLYGKPIEGHVVVDGVDHPVAPGPHRSDRICLKPTGVGVACDVEPVPRPAFSVRPGCEEPVHHTLVGSSRIVL